MNSLLFHLSQRGLSNTSFKALSPYAKGPGVRQLQQRLNRRFQALDVSGFMSVQVDGWFGNETMAAVKYLQCVGGLPVNGQVSARTQAFITEGAAGLEPLLLGSTGIGVLAVKQVLATKMDIPIAQDGRFCELTERAVMAYQQAAGLKSDGVVGAQTWEEIVRSRLGGLPCVALLPNVYTSHPAALN